MAYGSGVSSERSDQDECKIPPLGNNLHCFVNGCSQPLIDYGRLLGIHQFAIFLLSSSDLRNREIRKVLNGAVAQSTDSRTGKASIFGGSSH